MKKTITLFLIVVSFQTGFSQTATSIANGNWMNPTTWNCTCIPIPGYTVTINHAVALDTSWYIPSAGGITINASGSLIKNSPKRDLLVSGGNLTNHGTLDVRSLFTQTGTFSNSGTLTAKSFLNYVNFTNSGTIHNVDSLYSTGTIINNGNFLIIDSITTGGTFTNNGVCTYHQFTNTGQYTNNRKLTFTDFTNFGTFTNTDTVIGQQSFWNTEIFNNQSSGYILLNKSFLNADSIQHNSVCNNNGRMVINDSWYNSDTVKGTTGSIQVADSSVNWGFMKGTFDFCDLTPPTSSPYVDYNFGTIASGITWCQFTGISSSEMMEIKIYPNPSNGVFTISSLQPAPYNLEVYNVMGEIVFQSEIKNPKSEIHLDSPNGMYYLNIKTESGTVNKKLIIQK